MDHDEQQAAKFVYLFANPLVALLFVLLGVAGFVSLWNAEPDSIYTPLQWVLSPSCIALGLAGFVRLFRR